MTSCDNLREHLMKSDGGPLPRPEADHLARCEDCRRFAERLAATRDALRAHHGNVEPDAAFAARVAARLPRSSAELLGRMAARLIPATLALVLVLAWFAYRGAPVETTTAEATVPTEDLVGWVLDVAEEER
jgi:hypothetical protein